MSKCERCGGISNGTIMSMFNTQMICNTCKEEETRHPRYNEACERENEELLKGNLNFEGIGWDGLTYEERIRWFIRNYYETGMEYEGLLVSMKDEDLDNFKWYDEVIRIPKYKHEIK